MTFLRRNAQEAVIAVLTLAGLVWAFWSETPESVRARLDPGCVLPQLRLYSSDPIQGSPTPIAAAGPDPPRR